MYKQGGVKNTDKKSYSKLNLSERSFKQIIDANNHLDGKALRTTQAISFITVAVGAVYVGVSPGINGEDFSPERLELFYYGIHLVDISFIAYILSLGIGIIIYISALNKPLFVPDSYKENLSKIVESKTEFESLIFFDRVARVSPVKWNEFWKKSDKNEISKSMTSDYFSEAWLVAKGAREKYILIRIGGYFLVVCILFICLFVSGIADLIYVNTTKTLASSIVLIWGSIVLLLEFMRSYSSIYGYWLPKLSITSLSYLLFCILGGMPIGWPVV